MSYTRQENTKKPTLIQSKYMFSESFARLVHEFSKAHAGEGLKEFRKSYEEWIQQDEIQNAIRREMMSNQKETEEQIMKKIHISARFYYRKKTKRESKESKESNQNQNQKQAYIRFSKGFLKMIDKEIHKVMMAQEDNTKLCQSKVMETFTLGHIEDIRQEFKIMKEKYEKMSQEYIPTEITHKFKKTFNNRYYILFNKMK